MHDNLAWTIFAARLWRYMSGLRVKDRLSSMSSETSSNVCRAFLSAERAAWSILPNSRKCIIVRTLNTAWRGR